MSEQWPALKRLLKSDSEQIHTTSYEDDGCVGVWCPVDGSVDLHLDKEKPEPEECPGCHKKLVLHWDVWIEEVEEDAESILRATEERIRALGKRKDVP